MIEVERQPKNTYSRIRCSNNIYDEIANIANECDLTLKECLVPKTHIFLKGIFHSILIYPDFTKTLFIKLFTIFFCVS